MPRKRQGEDPKIAALREKLRAYDRSNRTPKQIEQYEAHKIAAAKRSRAQAGAARDIGSISEVADPQRRADCERDFRRFCEVYQSAQYSLAWSADHLRVIAKIETAVLGGGLFAVAMPRGSGKTTLCESACVWAALYGHRSFILLIGSEITSSKQMLESIKLELEANDLLAADFPEACEPIRALEGIANRCAGQTFQGERTRISWTDDKVILPTIPGSKSSGVVMRTTGITGKIRGAKHKRPDGKSVRPDLVILDDPQTDESARSVVQNATRLAVLRGAILGLAGPGKKITGIMPCTVIAPGDMADTILDRDLNPEWQGERTRMVYRFPDRMELWHKYYDVRKAGLSDGDGGAAGNEFYRQHRAEMDSGCQVAWLERFNPDELSAIQHAMNIKLSNPVAFAAEYQNDPMPMLDGSGNSLTPEDLVDRYSGCARGIVPPGMTRLTAFVDIQAEILYWAVMAFDEKFCGAVVDYGAWPRQYSQRFAANNAKPALSDTYPKHSREAAIYAGLRDLFQHHLGGGFKRHGDAQDVLRIDKVAIDANWGESTDIVYQFCRASQWAAMTVPSHGRGITASSKPMSEWQTKPGDRAGLNWRLIAQGSQTRRGRHIMSDVNFWKTFTASRFTTPIGSPGASLLFSPNHRSEHELLIEHLTSEYAIETAGRDRKLCEWKLHTGRENHWWDCVVGCHILASVLGVQWTSDGPGESNVGHQSGPQRVKLSEMQRRRVETKRRAA